MPAFQLAWEQEADAVELDILLTKDGRIVAFHDDTTRRIARVRRRVDDQSLDELRALDAGAWKDARWKGVQIPTLEEVLAALPDGKRLFIEIKCGAEVLPALGRALKASGKTARQIVIIGFDLETMKQAKVQFPDLPACWVASPKTCSFGRLPSVASLIARAKSANLDGLDVDVRFAIDGKFVSQVKDAGLKLYVWTVNNVAVARKLAALRVDGVTTNRPLFLREQLRAEMPRR